MKLLAALLLLCVSASAYAQVRMAMNGDKLKGNIKKMTEYQYNLYRPISNSILRRTDTMSCIYTCDSQGLQIVRVVSAYNNHHVSSSALMRFDNEGHPIEKDFYTDIDSLYMRYTYTYDGHGRETQECRVDYPFHASSTAEYGDVLMPVRDSMSFCSNYIYDSAGNLAELTSESLFGQNNTTDQRIVYTYDNAGNNTEQCNFQRSQRDNYVTFFVDGKEFTSKTIFKYDDQGRLAERTEYSLKKPDANVYLPPRENSSTLIGNKEVYTYEGLSNTPTSITFMRIYREKDGAITTEEDSTGEFPKNETTEVLDKQGNVIKRMNGNHVTLEREIAYF